MDSERSRRSPRLPTATCSRPGHHPGHPTADGGLSASKPGLRAGTHDLEGGVLAALFAICNSCDPSALNVYSMKVVTNAVYDERPKSMLLA